MENNKNLEENTKINADILKNEIPAVKENFLTLNSNIENIEQEVIKTSLDFNYVKPCLDLVQL